MPHGQQDRPGLHDIAGLRLPPGHPEDLLPLLGVPELCNGGGRGTIPSHGGNPPPPHKLPHELWSPFGGIPPPPDKLLEEEACQRLTEATRIPGCLSSVETPED